VSSSSLKLESSLVSGHLEEDLLVALQRSVQSFHQSAPQSCSGDSAHLKSVFSLWLADPVFQPELGVTQRPAVVRQG